jgi:hypothetical protein
MKIEELLEATYKSRTQPIDIYGQFLAKNCKIAYKSPIKIYRGLAHTEELILKGDSAKSVRKSANTANYYTQLIDNILPEWQSFPKRSRSFICTTSKENAMKYGTVYRVFPIDDPMIGICPNNDFWTSFKETNFDPCGFVYIFEKLGRITGIEASDNLSTIKRIINKVNILWKKDIKTGNYVYDESNIATILRSFVELRQSNPNLLEEFANKFGSFTEYLQWKLNPYINKFKLAPLSSLKSLGMDQEVWFSGPAYFIRNTELS